MPYQLFLFHKLHLRLCLKAVPVYQAWLSTLALTKSSNISLLLAAFRSVLRNGNAGELFDRLPDEDLVRSSNTHLWIISAWPEPTVEEGRRYRSWTGERVPNLMCTLHWVDLKLHCKHAVIIRNNDCLVDYNWLLFTLLETQSKSFHSNKKSVLNTFGNLCFLLLILFKIDWT